LESLNLSAQAAASATDAGVGDHAFDRRAVRIAQLRGEKRGHRHGLLHGAFFQRLTDAAKPAINGRTNADFRIIGLFHE
jgi:hypothetical protein